MLMPMIFSIVSMLLLASPVCEKPPVVKVPVLAPVECMSYSSDTHECAAACYWPGRPDGGAWDGVVRAFAPTKEGCRKLLEGICAAKRGAPR